MNDNLPELRDIHFPQDTISIWPLAYGWWLILSVILFMAAGIYLFRLYRTKSKKLYEIKLLDSLSNETSSAIKMSEILRRICIYKYPEASTLLSKEWINFLNSHSKSPIKDGAANLLVNAPYINPTSVAYSKQDIKDLHNFCRSWIGENL